MIEHGASCTHINEWVKEGSHVSLSPPMMICNSVHHDWTLSMNARACMVEGRWNSALRCTLCVVIKRKQMDHHVAIMELVHLLTPYVLTHPEVSSVVFPDFFCLSVCSVTTSRVSGLYEGWLSSSFKHTKCWCMLSHSAWILVWRQSSVTAGAP
jgi:hypothetical protein